LALVRRVLAAVPQMLELCCRELAEALAYCCRFICEPGDRATMEFSCGRGLFLVCRSHHKGRNRRRLCGWLRRCGSE